MGAFVKPLDKVDDFGKGEIAGAGNCRWLHICMQNIELWMVVADNPAKFIKKRVLRDDTND